MSNTSTEKSSIAQSQASSNTRKPYHSPKLENYGAVGILTRSGPIDINPDGTGGYNSLV